MDNLLSYGANGAGAAVDWTKGDPAMGIYAHMTIWDGITMILLPIGLLAILILVYLNVKEFIDITGGKKR